MKGGCSSLAPVGDGGTTPFIVPSLMSLCVEALMTPTNKTADRVVDLILTLNATVFMGCDHDARLVELRASLRRHALLRFDLLSERYGEETMEAVLLEDYSGAKVEQTARLEATRVMASCRLGQALDKPQVSGPREDGSIPYESLLAGVDWPAGVVANRREQSLSDEEFFAKFGMSKEVFNSPATDRIIRERLKKAVKLW